MSLHDTVHMYIVQVQVNSTSILYEGICTYVHSTRYIVFYVAPWVNTERTQINSFTVSCALAKIHMCYVICTSTSTLYGTCTWYLYVVLVRDSTRYMYIYVYICTCTCTYMYKYYMYLVPRTRYIVSRKIWSNSSIVPCTMYLCSYVRVWGTSTKYKYICT